MTNILQVFCFALIMGGLAGWLVASSEIKPGHYALVAQWNNDFTHSYIEECLEDGQITFFEYEYIKEMYAESQSNEWKRRLVK